LGRGPFRVDFFLFFSLSQKIDAWKIQRRLVDRQGGGRRRRAGGALSSLILSRACASPGRCLRASLRALRGKERQRGKAKEGESQSEQKNFISLSSLFSLLLIQHERPPFLFANKEKREFALVAGRERVQGQPGGDPGGSEGEEVMNQRSFFFFFFPDDDVIIDDDFSFFFLFYYFSL
jgi:hypothetical protein